MDHHKRMLLLFRLLPFRSWQYSFLQRHCLKCERCLANLAGPEDARKATFAQEKLGEARDFWPGFLDAAGTMEKKVKPRFRPSWRWAVGTAGLLAASAALVLITTFSPEKEAAGIIVRLRIDYAEVYGEPARAFIFQTQDANSTFVWVEKQEKGENQ